MSKTIVKDYVAFAATGSKTWKDNTPYIDVIVSGRGDWVNLDLTLEEAEKAIVILQEAIAEAKSIPDHNTAPWGEETPF
jgi:hypothetical protein